MEEFQKLNWNQPLGGDTTFVSAEEMKIKSFAYKFLDNSFKSYLSSDSSDEPLEEPENKKPMPKKKKKKTNNKSKKSKTNSIEKPALNEEGICYSSFNASQQASFLKVLLAAQNQPGDIPPHLRDVKRALEPEQTEFQNHIKHLWTTAYEKHNILCDDAQKYTEEKWKANLKGIEAYPQFYKLEKSIPLVYPSDSPDVQITPIQMLLEMGIVPKLHIPDIKFSPKLSTNYTQMLLLNSVKAEDSNSLLHKTVSVDRNAELLALKEKANVVISSSGLKCIADNVSSKYDKIWTIPVVIKEYKMKEGNSVNFHKVVYIDKKLPSKSMTASERNAWFHKLAVKTFLTNPADPMSFRYPEGEDIPLNFDIVETEADPQFLKSDGAKRTCGKCNLPVHQQSENCNFGNDLENSDSDNSCHLVIDNEIDGSVNLKESCSCVRESEIHEEQGNTIFSEYSPIPPPSRTNVTYRLWKLHCEERRKEDLHEGLLKHTSANKAFNVLVRCKLDACKDENNQVTPVCVSSKMEFQAEYGAEKISASMLAQEYVSLLFRPEASLTRIRMNALTEEIIMSEKSTIQDLMHVALSQYDLRIKRRILGSLYLVMSHLVTFKSGHYLLSHDVRNGPFINVLEKTDTSITYDLHADYKSVNPSLLNMDYIQPWTPIDTNVITAMHIASKHVPATFEPCK